MPWSTDAMTGAPPMSVRVAVEARFPARSPALLRVLLVTAADVPQSD